MTPFGGKAHIIFLGLHWLVTAIYFHRGFNVFTALAAENGKGIVVNRGFAKLKLSSLELLTTTHPYCIIGNLLLSVTKCLGYRTEN